MQDTIRAAGGVLWRRRSGLLELAVIHRPRHNDWSLPKGKLNPGETWTRGALREVEEETGCKSRILGLVGVIRYRVGVRPKIVRYYHLEHLSDGGPVSAREVDEVRWLVPAEALKILDRPSEKEIVQISLRRYTS